MARAKPISTFAEADCPETKRRNAAPARASRTGKSQAAPAVAAAESQTTAPVGSESKPVESATISQTTTGPAVSTTGSPESRRIGAEPIVPSPGSTKINRRTRRTQQPKALGHVETAPPEQSSPTREPKPAVRNAPATGESEDSAAPPVSTERLLELSRGADKGDQSCRIKLREILDAHPMIWHKVGDIASFAEGMLLKLVSRSDTVVEESTALRLRELKSSLTGSEATPLEKMLIDFVCVTWLATLEAEIRSVDSDGEFEQQLRFRYKRAESAQRRYASALRMLAEVRAGMPNRSGAKTIQTDLGFAPK
jgi:hypothetical protein